MDRERPCCWVANKMPWCLLGHDDFREPQHCFLSAVLLSFFLGVFRVVLNYVFPLNAETDV